MISRSALTLSIIAALVVSGIAFSDDKSAPDLSTPKKAENAYSQALITGDANAIKAVTIYDAAWERVIDAQADHAKADIELWKAVRDKWGKDSLDAFPDPVIRDVPEAQEKIESDSATIVFHEVVVCRLKKVAGQWKVDLVTPISDMPMDTPEEWLKGMKAEGGASKKVLAMVRANQCSSPADAKQALSEAFEEEYTGKKMPSTRASIKPPATQP